MGGVRPFGCSLLVIGKDELSGPMLYQCDPSGCYFPWKATALGKFILYDHGFFIEHFQAKIIAQKSLRNRIQEK